MLAAVACSLFLSGHVAAQTPEAPGEARVHIALAAAPSLLPSAPALVAAAPDADPKPAAKAPVAPPDGLSLSGPTGLFRVPNAAVQPTGTERLGLTQAPRISDKAFPGNRSRWQFTLGVCPRVEFGGTYFGQLRDITLHAKIQLLREQHSLPAIAVGTTDERAGFLERTRYIALSKHLLDQRVRVTAGWGHGGLDGFFGGVEAAVIRQVTLVAEYDTRQVNYGVRLAPTPRVQFDVARVKGGWAGQLGYGFSYLPQTVIPAAVKLTRPTEPLEPQALAERLQEAVCALGMENVRTEVGGASAGQTAVVYYENRCYTHDDTQALTRVLAAAVGALPPSVSRLAVVATKFHTPVLRVMVNPGDYARFVGGELPADHFRQMVSFGHSGSSPLARADVAGRTALRRSTLETVDIAVQPVSHLLFGSEETQLSVRNSLRPDLTTELVRGGVVDLIKNVQVSGSLGRATNALFSDNAAYASYFRQPFPGAYVRLAGGQFLGRRRGGAAEGAVLFGGDHCLLRGFVASLANLQAFPPVPYLLSYVADLRYYLPGLDLTASATVGRYVNLDHGFTVALRKYFGDTEFSLQFRHTDEGKAGVISIAVPIGPQRSPRPAPVRVRLADRYSLGLRSLAEGTGVFGDVQRAQAIGNQLDNFDLTDTLLNRGRLRASYLRSHLSEFVQGAAAVTSP